jgi:hypothetical protein
MKLPWKRKLPTGDALVEEARRLGVSEHEIWKGGAEGHTILDEPELQRRVLAARGDRRSAILNFAQTIGIIGTLLFYIWTQHVQSVRTSADLMLAFEGRLTSGKSEAVVMALEMNGNLDKTNVDDEAIDDFLGKYELLAAAYSHNLIDREMAYDAFSYDLETALRDAKVKRFLLDARHDEGDFYDGVLKLAEAFGIATSTFVGTPSAHASP